MAGKLVAVGISHWRFTLGDAGDAGLFRSVSGQGASAEYMKWPYISDQGAPVNAWVPTGGHLNYEEPITLERGVDTDLKLWSWINKSLSEGTAEQREGTIEMLNFNGQPVAKFKLTGVYPSTYSTSELDASSKAVLLENLGLSYETWEREA